MKTTKLILAALVYALIASAIGIGANFSKTYDVPTRRDWISQENQAIAELSYDFDALISSYNTALGTGQIPIPITAWREVSDGDVPNLANHGGILASDSTPILEAIDATSDSGQRIHWAASNSDPLMFQVPLPPDIDTTAALIFRARFGNDGNTDQTSPTLSVFFNEGDTKIDVTTDSFNDATADSTYVSYDFSIAASNIDSTADGVTLILTPGAHTTNALYMSNARLIYTRDF